MNKFLSVALTAAAAIVSLEARAEYWMDAVVCNGGKVKVQIDAGERRSSRVIIADRSVKHYFIKALTTSLSDDNGFRGGLYEYFDRDRYFSPRVEGPMLVRAWSNNGAFRIEQFQHTHQGPVIHTTGTIDCAPHSGGCGDTGPAIDIRRYGDGLKLEIWRPRFSGRYCVESDSYSGQCIRYSSAGEWSARELANWWFPSCELRELLP